MAKNSAGNGENISIAAASAWRHSDNVVRGGGISQWLARQTWQHMAAACGNSMAKIKHQKAMAWRDMAWHQHIINENNSGMA